MSLKRHTIKEGYQLKNKRQISSFLGIVCLLSGLVFHYNSFAESRTKITTVNLDITSHIQTGTGGYVSVTSNDTAYTIGDITIINDDDEWTGNFKPRVRVYLEAQEGYYFSGTSKSIFRFSGDECTFVSAKRRDSSSGLDLTFKMGRIGSGDLNIYGLEWDPSSGIASWDEVAGAKSYQVCLYRGTSSFSGIKSTTNTRYNFSSIIDQQGDYCFRVRSIGYNSETGDWEESDYEYISASQISSFYYESRSNTPGGSSYSGPGVSSSSQSSATVGPGYGTSGTWKKDAVGWWFQFPNNTYPVNCWQYIGNRWYYFNQYGYMTVGWIKWNSNWYYCGSDGAMYANSRTPDGFYVGGDGAWIP